MSQPPIRAVLDTGVWVDIYLQNEIYDPKQPYRAILDAFFAREFVPVYSEETFDELLRVLTRGRLIAKHGIDPVKGGAFVGIVLTKAAEEVSIEGAFHVSTDEDDDPIAETALVAKVDFLVADDQHLHEPRVIAALQAAGIKVVWAKQFRKALHDRRQAQAAAESAIALDDDGNEIAS
jgi:predicted nucleic acid-binding protein